MCAALLRMSCFAVSGAVAAVCLCSARVTCLTNHPPVVAGSVCVRDLWVCAESVCLFACLPAHVCVCVWFVFVSVWAQSMFVCVCVDDVCSSVGMLAC